MKDLLVSLAIPFQHVHSIYGSDNNKIQKPQSDTNLYI
jgi:hypothetical protein